MNSIFSATNAQKTLDFLIQFPDNNFIADEIHKKTKISRGGINQSLRLLAKYKYINRDKKGKIFLYSLNYANPIIKQYKILKTVEYLNTYLNKFKILADKIVLFGSSARGENGSDSDIDLFLSTSAHNDIENIISKIKSKRKLQIILRTPLSYMEMKDKEPIFYNEINRGIILWEKKT